MKEPSKETAMVVYKPWSTFPRERFMIKTHPATAAVAHNTCRESRIEEESFQSQSTNEEDTVDLVSELPKDVAKSLWIVLERTRASQDERDEHVYALACYFASSASQEAKLARLKALVTRVTPKEALWQLLDPILRDTLRFLTDRSFDWPHAQHSAHVVLLELRAMSLYIKERQPIVVKSSEVAAGCIFGAARLVEHGLTCSIPLIHTGLDLAGSQAKHILTPSPKATIRNNTRNTRGEIVTRTYTNVAKRATDGVRLATKCAAYCIRDASTESIYKIAQRFDEQRLGERLVPNEGHRNVLVAAGTVGIASIGAAAIVGEAVVTTSASVACKSASVAADVVRYKYGDHAGQVVEDASHTTGNILRTVAHITMLETSVLAKVVAKKTVVLQAKKSMDGVEEISAAVHDYQTDSLTALKAGSFESHLTKVDPQAAAHIMSNRTKQARHADTAPAVVTPEKPSPEETACEKNDYRDDLLTALKAGSVESHLTKVDPQAAAHIMNIRMKQARHANTAPSVVTPERPSPEETACEENDYRDDLLTALKAVSFESHLTKVDPQAASLVMNNRNMKQARSDTATVPVVVTPEKPPSEKACEEKEDDW